MATYKLILTIGDSNNSGAVQNSAFSAYPSLQATQTDYKIWNIANQAWESYTAGTNSQWSSIATQGSYVGPEVNMHRVQLDDGNFAPGDELHLIKLGSYQLSLLKWDNSITLLGASNPGGVNYDSAWPLTKGDIWTNTGPTPFFGWRKQITEAVDALLNGAGGPHKVELHGLVFVFGTLDALAPYGYTAFGNLLKELYDQVYAYLADDGVTIPETLTHGRVAVVNMHDDYVHATSAEAARFAQVRSQIRRMPDLIPNCIVIDNQFATTTDNVHFDADSLVDIGAKVSRFFFGGQVLDFGGNDNPTEPTDPLDLYLLIGDSLMRGYGQVASLPAYLGSAQSGVYCWQPSGTGSLTAGTWQSLDAGTSNQPGITTTEVGSPNFGPEMSFAEEARQSRRNPVYLVKLAVGGATASYSDSSYSTSDTFLLNPSANDFHPLSQDEFYDYTVAWLREGVQKLIDAGETGNIRFRGGVIMLGTNDASKVDGGVNAREVEASLKTLISRLRNAIKTEMPESILTEGDEIKFVVVQPDGAYSSLQLTENHTDAVRAGVREVAEDDDAVAVLDPTGRYTFADTVHYDTAGNLKLGKDLFDLLSSGSFVEVVSPLFVESRDKLVSRLRLEGMPLTSNGQDLVDESIQAVKGMLYRRLGKARVDYLQSLPFSPSPKDDPGYLKLLANTTETKWVRLELMRIMPMMFVEGNSPNEVWQNEAGVREAGVGQVRSEMNRIRSEVEDALEVLSGNIDVTELDRIKINPIGPENDPPLPGDSVRIQGGTF